MIISGSNVGMDSARSYSSVSREAYYQETAVRSFGAALDDRSTKNKKAEDALEQQDQDTSLSEKNTKNDFDNIYMKMRDFSTSKAYENKLEHDRMQRIRTECLQYLLYFLFGKKPSGDYNLEPQNENIKQAPITVEASPAPMLTTTTYYSNFMAESEETVFETTGTVVTSTGREISFNLNLSMSRSFASYYEQTVSRTTSFVDPLVINLDSDIASVSDMKISFDIDADGKEESISRLSSSSGYLALDRNGDGIINDGSELFGTKSGDGFADLAEYDTDHNGWIDEADEIFDKLKIYIQNEDGSQTLYKLKEKGVGAICLKNSSTDFSLNDLSTNQTNAAIRKTGIFLYENGNVGTVQHLDLAQ